MRCGVRCGGGLPGGVRSADHTPPLSASVLRSAPPVSSGGAPPDTAPPLSTPCTPCRRFPLLRCPYCPHSLRCAARPGAPPRPSPLSSFSLTPSDAPSPAPCAPRPRLAVGGSAGGWRAGCRRCRPSAAPAPPSADGGKKRRERRGVRRAR